MIPGSALVLLTPGPHYAHEVPDDAEATEWLALVEEAGEWRLAPAQVVVHPHPLLDDAPGAPPRGKRVEVRPASLKPLALVRGVSWEPGPVAVAMPTAPQVVPEAPVRPVL